MATLATVSTGLAGSDEGAAAHPPAPTTPNADHDMLDQPADDGLVEDSTPNTPTRHSFAGLAGQKPLPDNTLTPGQTQEEKRMVEQDAHSKGNDHSTQMRDQDLEMGDADDGDGDHQEDAGSDNESVTSESQRPSKKKKGQRFFCTEFPPCQLSFTRSEHLARHIRKHTGERPFQCHCSRRFSRLDNLRQHAQTVHVNEEIPGDSLAATSTRYQRQIRTDRVRPPGSRSRASTLGSQGGHSRGHSRNLSTSSIGSTASSIGTPEDARRRPQPLAMANDAGARARLSLETYNSGITGSPQSQYIYYNSSHSGYSTPTSTAISTGGQSPRFQSGMVSPSPSVSRSSFYNGVQAHGRRLSVPSSQNPFQHPSTPSYPPQYFGASPLGQAIQFSPNGSMFASPTNSVFSHGRRESETEMELRRRTWHPSTASQYAQRPATSGLTYHQTPDEPRPAFTRQQAASQMTRLPGIESFDHAPPTGARQQPSPMLTESSPRPTSSGRTSDVGLQHGLTRLDIATANAPGDPQWQANTVAQSGYVQQPAPPQQYAQPKHMSMPEQPVTPRRNKRNAWYGGPITPTHGNHAQQGPQRPSPEDSSSSDGVPTPAAAQGVDYNPVIIASNGAPEYGPGTAIPTDEQKMYYSPGHQARADSGYQGYMQNTTPYAMQSGHDPRFAQSNYVQPPNNDMAKLEALVAVATSEGNRTAEQRS